MYVIFEGITVNGCVGIDTVLIHTYYNDVFIPNAFSPNGDGLNDMFYPQGRGINIISQFLIFNRWGEMVFEGKNFPCNDPNYGWNGMFKNTPLPPDVYVYIVEANCENNEKIMLKGDVSLIR